MNEQETSFEDLMQEERSRIRKERKEQERLERLEAIRQENAKLQFERAIKEVAASGLPATTMYYRSHNGDGRAQIIRLNDIFGVMISPRYELVTFQLDGVRQTEATSIPENSILIETLDDDEGRVELLAATERKQSLRRFLAELVVLAQDK